MVGKSERAGGRGDVGVWRLRSFGHLRWSRPESKTRTLSDAFRMTAQLDMRNVRVASAVAGVDGVKAAARLRQAWKTGALQISVSRTSRRLLGWNRWDLRRRILCWQVGPRPGSWK